MIRLTDEMRAGIDSALADRVTMVVAYTAEDGQPNLSYRGSVQATGDAELSMWVRDPNGGILKAIANNPKLALMYRKERTGWQFQGRARIDSDEAVRTRVYDNSHELERQRDPDRKGVAVIIDLDLVAGGSPDARVRMTRD
jgi:predicted pyridoxine 5'-phosphate oxidase superfamily flavin-nucleotide-binding protein